MKRILVTGANGLIGHEIVIHLQKNPEYRVVSMVNATQDADLKNILQKDIVSETLDDVRSVDVIVHCAAVLPGMGHSDEDVVRSNRIMDDRVIEYCNNHECKLIYFSGTSIYGFTKATKIYSESSKINPTSSYERGKSESESKIRDSDFPYTILRIPSPYGYRQRTRNVLKIFIDNAFNGKPLTYYGSGSRTQNFIEVSDIANVMESAIELSTNDIFNIAYEMSCSMKELAYIVADQAKKCYGLELEISAVGIDPQEELRTNISIQKAKEILNWKPQISLEQGIERWMKMYDHSYSV